MVADDPTTRDSPGGSVLSAPAELPEELFETLLRSDSVHIERIVSRGHATPAGEWYDQDRDEFVLLVQGAARLAWADGGEVELRPGDWLNIPARRKHRVTWTDPDSDTVWLAVHFRQQAGKPAASRLSSFDGRHCQRAEPPGLPSEPDPGGDPRP